MPTVLDILTSPEFASDELTAAINVPPFVTGRLAQLGVFTDVPIWTTYIRIQIEGTTITVIPARERGGPANKNMREGGSRVLLEVPHFPLDDAITPSDIQNLTAYGADLERVKMTLAMVVNQKLLSLRQKHDATLHHMEWGAINGLVLDGEGKVLADLWDEFDISQPTFDMALDTAGTDVAAKNRAVKQKIKRALRGRPFSGVRVFAGPSWFDKYVGHTNVKEAYKFYQQAGQSNPQRDDIDDVFVHAGLAVERVEEEFSIRRPNGALEVLPAVPDNGAIAIPLGTGFFKRYLAPPDTIADANQAPNPGDRVHVSTEPLDHGKGQEIHTESNVIPICEQPDLMIKLT